MGLTIAQKIIKEHLVSGEMKQGEEIALRIDQTLTQDATGTMAYLEFEAMGIPRVRTEKSIAYSNLLFNVFHGRGTPSPPHNRRTRRHRCLPRRQ